jgi:simple sugar transport system ATP-binding protein
VLVISEELEELLELSDRLYVMANGQLSPSLSRAQADVSRIGEWMSGLWHNEEVAHVAS